MTKTLLAVAVVLLCSNAAAAQANDDPTPALKPVAKRAAAQRSTAVSVRKRPTTISYISPRIQREAAEGPWSTPLFQQARPLR